MRPLHYCTTSDTSSNIYAHRSRSLRPTIGASYFAETVSRSESIGRISEGKMWTADLPPSYSK